MEQDWRLRGQEEYLRKIPLYKIIFPEFCIPPENCHNSSITNTKKGAPPC